MKPSASKSEPWRAKGRFRRRRRNVVEICYLYLILLRICDLIIIYFNPSAYKITLLEVESLLAIIYKQGLTLGKKYHPHGILV